MQSGLISINDCDKQVEFEINEDQEIYNFNDPNTENIILPQVCELEEININDMEIVNNLNGSSEVIESEQNSNNYLQVNETPVTNKEEQPVTNKDETDSDPEYLLPLSRLVKPKLKRKNTADLNEWKVKKQKKLRMKGQEYLGYRRPGNSSKVFHDTIRKARKMKEACNSEICKKSNKRFCNEIKEEERLVQYERFWNYMDWEQRKVFISSLVDCQTASRTRTSANKSRRSSTFIYHLNIGGIRTQVCKKTFLNTFSLGEWSARNWAIEKENHAGIHMSKENKNEARSETLRKPKKEEQMNNLITYLEATPKLPSHYCRKQTTKLYLEQLFTTMTQFFNHYVEYCNEKQILHLSRQVFDKTVSKMNISIFHPKKDACDTCVKHEIGNLTEAEYKLHIERKEMARQEKNEDKKKAQEGKCSVITADLQAVKLSPFFNASALYYKTKLCVHNYTTFNLATHDVVCYWWNESEGELVASVFASCLIDYLNKYKDSGKPIVIWTDGCTYQNRNCVMSSALLKFSINNNIILEQKYLERGHTQMECDSVHAVIEKKLKNRVIHLPSDYVAVAKEARTNPRPYEVKYLSYDFFSDYASDKLCSSIRPGSMKVTELRCLKYLPEGKIMYKCNFSEDYKELPQRLKALKKNPRYVPPRLYNNPIKIKTTKWQHLQQLKDVLPKECHHFYDNLLHQ